MENRLTLDTVMQVFFYEQDLYCLSNFSSFNLKWKGLVFPTSEYVYHWEKFNWDGDDATMMRPRLVQEAIINARSSHEALVVSRVHKPQQRPDWESVRLDIMKSILLAKVDQHYYVYCKLVDTVDRELIENSWRDDFWGWGPNRDGKNMLGKLWMEIRAELQLKKRNVR